MSNSDNAACPHCGGTNDHWSNCPEPIAPEWIEARKRAEASRDERLERALWIARYMHGCDSGSGPIEALEQAIRELVRE